MDKISYALGLSIGNNFQNAGIKDLQVDDFVKGLQDVLTGGHPEISYEEAKQVINDYFTKLQKEKLELNKQAGEEFLKINKGRAGVVTLPSGLQYQILNQGKGAKPTKADKVKCHYHGTLINGTVFDSSIQRGQPAVFGVSQVIPGWTEALQLSVVVATVLVAMGMTSCGNSHRSASLKTGVDSASYAIGIANGAQFRQMMEGAPGEPMNMDDLLAGFEVALKNDSAAMRMTPQAAQAFIQTYFMQVQTREANANKEEGEKFLEENKTKKDVFTTESGLQYQVVTEGTGEKPTEKDRVKVHYTGTLLDGTKFDSSVDRGEPAEFPVNGVIKGWTEILQLMPVGSKYIVWVPSELAYGERGAGSDIGPNKTLKFEIELLEIVKEDADKK